MYILFILEAFDKPLPRFFQGFPICIVSNVIQLSQSPSRESRKNTPYQITTIPYGLPENCTIPNWIQDPLNSSFPQPLQSAEHQGVCQSTHTAHPPLLELKWEQL